MGMSYKRIYLGSTSTLVSLFIILTFAGLQIDNVSENFQCTGDYRTESMCLDLNLTFGKECGPCMSNLRITNPQPKNIYVYNKGQFDIEFEPEVLDSAFYVKDGRCSGKLTGSSCSCYLNDGTEYAIKGWRCVDFTNRTKPRQDRIYNYKWSAYSTKEHLLIGFKEDPEQEVSWTTSYLSNEGRVIEDVETLWLPYTNGPNSSRVHACEDVQYKNIKTKEVNGTVLMDTYKYSKCETNGEVLFDDIVISIEEGFNCKYTALSGLLQCDSKYDGDGNGICNVRGGESCRVCQLYSNGTYYCEDSVGIPNPLITGGTS